MSVRRNVRSNNCFPDSLNSIDAISYPVRDDLKNQGWLRWIGATPVTNNRGGYSHEAFWAVGPLLAVHQDMPDSPANTPLAVQRHGPPSSTRWWRCSTNEIQRSWSTTAVQAHSSRRGWRAMRCITPT